MSLNKSLTSNEYYVIHQISPYGQDQFLIGIQTDKKGTYMPIWSDDDPIYKTILFDSYKEALNFINGDQLLETDENGNYKFTLDHIKNWRKTICDANILQVIISVKPVPSTLLAKTLTTTAKTYKDNQEE